MAPRLTYPLGLVGACAVLAVMTLPPRAAEGIEQRRAMSAEHRTAGRLRRELAVATETLRRLRWSDSLAALTLGARDAAAMVRVGIPSALLTVAGIEAESALAGRVRAEVERLPGGRPAVDLGVYLLDSRSASEAIAEVDDGYQRYEWYAGTSDGRPYCIAARSSANPKLEDLSTYGWGSRRRREHGILGVCALYAQYGQPGPAIQEWLRSGGAVLARDQGETPVPDLPARPRLPFARYGWTSVADLVLQGCLVSKGSACAALVLDPVNRYDDLPAAAATLVRSGVPLLDVRYVFGRPDSRAVFATERMFDDLEKRFGADRFSRFWSSDRSVEDAFTEAFAMTPAAWGLEWASAVWGDRESASVAPGVVDVVPSLIFVMLAITWAGRIYLRRRLG